MLRIDQPFGHHFFGAQPTQIQIENSAVCNPLEFTIDRISLIQLVISARLGFKLLRHMHLGCDEITLSTFNQWEFPGIPKDMGPPFMVHPGRLTWNLQITHLERKMIFQTSMILFHVNLPGCKLPIIFPYL